MSLVEIAAVEPGFLSPTWQTGFTSTLASQPDPQGFAPAPQSGFADLLVSGLQAVDQQVSAANTAVADFALGADLPPHQVVMALEQARMSLQFALQVRSRLVEGYQELMRMQL
jgi:flagellar hook-basal body complex protein FliE